MYAYDIKEFIGIAISLVGIVLAVLHNGSAVIATVGCLVALIAIILLWFAWGRHNRSYTLQVLSKENRGLSIRLLLTYSWLLHGEGKRINKFRPSKLHIAEAEYRYRFKRADPHKDIFDMDCAFHLKVSSCIFSRLFLKDFDILIVQPAGTLIDSIEYSFDGGYRYRAKTSAIHISDGGKTSPKLLKATIPFNGRKNVKFLDITYSMTDVDEINQDHLNISILACPFFYARKMKNINFVVEYPSDVGYRPKVMCLKKYPYDGKRYASEKLLDFESENDFLRWTGCPAAHTTQAIYVIEMHGPVKCAPFPLAVEVVANAI